jgi:hypothetical protein
VPYATAANNASTGRTGAGGHRSGGAPFGLDLAALNVQRGRDHGLPGFNEVRKALGLPPREFSDGSWNASGCVVPLSELYRSPATVDLWVGGLCERPLATAPITASALGDQRTARGDSVGLLGETFAAVIATQFHALRAGDRFWHEAEHPYGLGREAAAEVHRTASLASILRRHGVAFDATDDARYIFKPKPDSNAPDPSTPGT